MSIIDTFFTRIKALWQMSGEWNTPRAQEFTKRYTRHERAWSAYYGRLPKPLRVKPNNPDDNIQINYARLIVDASVSALFGDNVVVSLGDGFDAEQTYINEWKTAVELQQVLADAGVNGGVCGTVFVRMFEKDAESGIYPRIINIAPSMVDVETEPDDYQRVKRFIITYPAPATANTPNGSQGLLRKVIERDGAGWVVHEQSASFGGFTTIASTRWSYPFAPVFYCKNLPAPNEFWGVADLEPDTIDLMQSVNTVRSNTNRIIRYHAHPKTIGTGFDATALSAAPDQMITINNPDAKVFNLEMQSDLSASRDFARDIESALHAVTRTPEAITGKVEGIGSLSGVALKILYRPMSDKIESKRRLYGAMIAKLVRAALVVGGYENAARNAVVTIVWPELVPSDPKTEREVAVMDHELGASKTTLLNRFGYDAEKEAGLRGAEDGNTGEALLTAFDRGV